MSASPSRIPADVAAAQPLPSPAPSLLSLPVTTLTGEAGKTGSTSEHHDSGIENCHSSDASNYCHTTDHDREEDLTTATTLTTTHRDAEDESSSGSDEDRPMNDELADYEIVQLSEEVKVTRPKAQHEQHQQPERSAAAATLEAKQPRLDNSNKVATSKEEKQRQNEEIIILESSSVSSETGSWESVTPEQLQQIQSHQQIQLPAGGGAGNLSDLTPVNVAADGCAIVAPAAACLAKFTDYDAKPIRTACFIDASSLLDDSELAALASPQPTQEIARESEEEPKLVAETKPMEHEIKDQFSSGEYTPQQMSGSMDSSAGDGVGAGGRKSCTPPRGSVTLDPKESEKLQGGLVFKNSINQYSGVLIEDPETETETDGPADTVSECPSGDGDSEFPANRSYPLRNTRSDFTSLMDIYHENKKNGSNNSGGGGNGGGGAFKFNYMRTQSENHATEPQSIILPDTPHNSILNVNIVPTSDTRRGRLKSGEGDEEEQSEAMDENRTPRRLLKYMESAPIVSGGVSVADFSPRLCESPPVRRKLDTCPILSGGFMPVSVPEGVVEGPANVLVRPTESASFKSWVIDLNDLPQAEEEKQTEQVAVKKTSQSVPTQKYSHFYVSLDDNGQEAEKEPSDSGNEREGGVKNEAVIQSASAATSMKKSTGFFVDFTATQGAKESPKSREVSVDRVESVSSSVSGGDNKEDSSDDKKNMFSMFIDFGERKPVPKKEALSFTSRLSESISRRKEHERRSESPRSSCNNSERIEVEKCTSLPFVPLSDRRGEEVQMRPKFRASLSVDQRNAAVPENRASSAERPISFTAGDKGLMSIIDKIPLLSKTSSMSIDSSISPIEDFTCSKSELSTFSTSATSNSNNSSTKELNRQLQGLGGSAEKRHQKDVKINETYDKSSQSSITDGALSKDLSPDSATATNTEDLTYQNDPELVAEATRACDAVIVKAEAAAAGLSTILETNEKLASPAKKTQVREDADKVETTHTMETLQATIEKQRKLLLETVNEAAESTSFVRLSDMDKPFQSFEIYSGGGMGSLSLTKSGSGGDRRSRSMAGHDAMGGGRVTYYEKTRHNNMYYSTDTNIINLASSFENSRSLSRIFPHLSKAFSSSLPANVGLENMPSEMTSMSSDLSANSSVTSSCNPSVQDSGDDASIFCRQPKRLGEDLLKMFLHEIGTDVTIDIGGHRKLKAHKCILQSRCQYFAAILAGGYVHNAGNQISLPGYSYEAVHFALCHIYSGASHPPEGISLMELAAIADLLGLVGLREVTEYALKVNYCHNFHKPCLGCIEGILQVLPVALNHGLDDLYRKCLKWTCKHYLKIWPTRTFASLTSDLRHRCQQQIIAHLSAENVLTRILECENLLAVVAPLRWGQAVEIILHEISDTAQIYLSEHFASLIASDSFLSLGHDQSSNIPALENLLLRSASTLSPDQACRSYQRASKLHQVLHSKVLTQQQNKIRVLVGGVVDADDLDWDVDFIRLVGGLLSAVEQCLQRQCSRAMRTSAWQRLDLELRKKVQKLACLTDPLFERRQRANARQQQQQKTPNYQANYNRNQDIQQVRLAIHAHSKRSAQGYIIDQFTNNNHNQHHQNAGGGERGRAGHNQFKSHSTTQTQTHLNNNHNANAHTEGRGKERRDKGIQAAATHDTATRTSHTTNGAARLEKSKSHSHVNRSSTGMGSQANNRASTRGGVTAAPPAAKSSTALQRNASTSQVVGAGNRLRTDVKSRYMNISGKESHRTAQPTNDAVRQVKQSDYSSSGTSTRTASPQAIRKAALAVAPKHIDSHMSLDSLASPKKQPMGRSAGAVTALPVHHDDNSLSRDSLADSVRSSVRTEATISQESLHRNRLSVDSRVAAKNLRNAQPKQTMNGGSTSGGSTSSVGKGGGGGGRLMRNFSDSGVVFRNPGNASKGLSSNTSSSNASTRTSFLSKKSREILERRSLAENQQQLRESMEKATNPCPADTMRRSLPINKSSSTSNIPTNRRIFNTTLHLRKTAEMVIPERAAKRESQVGLKPSRIAQKVPLRVNNGQNDHQQGRLVRKLDKSERDLISTEKAFEVLGLNHSSSNNCDDSMDGGGGFEAKMVRSSTFSKDCPDLSQSIEIS